MIQSRRRQNASVAVSKSAIDDAFSTLQQLPEKPKENLSLKEAVEHLMDSIQAALAKGYSLEEVSEMLTGKGVDITPASLKYYLARSRRGQTATAATKTRKPRKSRNATTDATEAEQPSVEPAIEASAPAELNGAASDTEPKKRAPRRSKKTESTETPKTTSRTKTAAKTTSTRTRRKKTTS